MGQFLVADDKVADLKVFQVQEYLEERKKEVSVNSFNVYRNHGLTIIKWAMRQQLLPRDTLNVFEAIPLLPYEKNDKGPAPIDSVLKVMGAADAEQKDLLLAYLLTGARKSEVLKMVWSDIDFDNRTYLLHTKKTGSGVVKISRHNMSELFYELLQK